MADKEVSLKLTISANTKAAQDALKALAEQARAAGAGDGGAGSHAAGDRLPRTAARRAIPGSWGRATWRRGPPTA